jgi:hypothetical protein
MRIVVERIDAPFAARAVMRGVPNAIDGRVAQVDVRAREVDLEAQHVRAVRKFPFFHPPEQIEILFHRALAIRTGLPGFGQGAAQFPQLLASRAIDVGEPGLDEMPSEFVQAVEIIRRVIKMRSPVVPEPAHRVLDRLLVFDVLLDRVRVVVAQVTGSAILGCEPEIETDRFRVPDMEVAIGLGRKASDHSPAVLAAALMLGDDLPKEIRRRRRGRILPQCSSHFTLFMNKSKLATILTAVYRPVMSRHARRMSGFLRKPHPARLCERPVQIMRRLFPQYLWIIVCISCTFDS